MTNSHTSNGITITVEPKFDGDIKDISSVKFVFSYTITLYNGLPHSVQLISRRWIIFDSIGTKHTVEGEGVVGVQPIIKPGETFTYASWCPLESTMGRMKGNYSMLNIEDNAPFEIEIPSFVLEADWVKN